MSKILLTLAAGALLAGCNLIDSDFTADRKPKMDKPIPKIEKLFAETKPICFGRFVIDIPKTAQVVWGPTNVGWEIVSYPGQANKVFAEIRDKTEEFKNIKHLEVSSALVGAFDGPNPQSKIVVGYPSRHDAYETKLYSYIKLQPHAFVQTAAALMAENALVQPQNPEGYRKTLAELQDTARRLRVREETDIPAEPGICIEAGFISEADGRYHEMTSIGFRFPEYPDVTFSIQTQKTDRVDEANSLDWSLKKGKEFAGVAGKGEWYSRIKTLREGKRRIGDWEGAEKLGRKPATTDGTPSVHEFLFQSAGVANDMFRPIIDMDLHSGVEVNGKGGNEPSLKDDEAVALWDKLTTSIRARPTGGRVEQHAADKPVPPQPPQAKAPLGTTLASGTRCPQTGAWVCDQPDALSGNRRDFQEGETLPSVLAPVKLGLWQKMKGDAPTRLSSTTWTLTELPPEVAS